MDRYQAQTQQIQAFLRAKRPKSALAVVVLNAPLTQRVLWVLGTITVIAMGVRPDTIATLATLMQ